jgi:hypothetical protein
MNLAGTFALLVAGVAGASTPPPDANFDIRVVCDAQTKTSNMVWIASRSPDPADQGRLCIDKASGVSSLGIVSVDLGHNRLTSDYALRLHIDPARTSALNDLSARSQGRELAFVKGGRYVAHAGVYGPFEQGIVTLIIPEKETAIKVADILFNRKVATP